MRLRFKIEVAKVFVFEWDMSTGSDDKIFDKDKEKKNEVKELPPPKHPGGIQ